MRQACVQSGLWRLMITVAAIGVGLFFLKSLVSFLDSPFLGPDPREEAATAPILLLIRASACGVAIWGLVILWR